MGCGRVRAGVRPDGHGAGISAAGAKYSEADRVKIHLILLGFRNPFRIFARYGMESKNRDDSQPAIGPPCAVANRRAAARLHSEDYTERAGQAG